MRTLGKEGLVRRAHDRISIVIDAVLVDGSSHPITLCNISPSGAMAQGAVIPPAGSSLLVKRGRLHTRARVVWVRGRSLGLSFDSEIDVDEWTETAAPAPQAIADRMFALTRIHRPALPGRPKKNADHLPCLSSTDPACLSHALSFLSAFDDVLADDPSAFGRHGAVLHRLDNAIQRLDGMTGTNHPARSHHGHS